jgi:acetolactate synthase-1/2/3 large subunit
MGKQRGGARHDREAKPAIDQVRRLLAKALRPVLVLGGSGWNETARSAVARFAAANGLPVAVSFRRQGLFDHEHSIAGRRRR